MSDSPISGDSSSRVLDLTTEPADTTRAAPTVKTIEERREDTRSAIAVSLLVGLAVVTTAWVAVGIWGDRGDIAATGDGLRTVFAGLLGLTGTVIGFYFGGQSKGQ